MMISSLIASDALALNLSHHSSRLRKRNIVPVESIPKKSKFSPEFLEIDTFLKKLGLLNIFKLSVDETDNLIDLLEGRNVGSLLEIIHETRDLIGNFHDVVPDEVGKKGAEKALKILEEYENKLPNLGSEQLKKEASQLKRKVSFAIHPDKMKTASFKDHASKTIKDFNRAWDSLTLEIENLAVTNDVFSIFSPTSYDKVIQLIQDFEEKWFFQSSQADPWVELKKTAELLFDDAKLIKDIKYVAELKRQGKEPSKQFQREFFKGIFDKTQLLIRKEKDLIDDLIVTIGTKNRQVFKNKKWLLLQKELEDRSDVLKKLLDDLQSHGDVMTHMTEAYRHHTMKNALVGVGAGFLVLFILAILKKYMSKRSRKLVGGSAVRGNDGYSRKSPPVSYDDDFDSPDLLISTHESIRRG